jgi:hypothetical protein
MKRSGIADLPLHGGRVPLWLAERMTRLGAAIVEAILLRYGHCELLSRLADPFWFQALGSVVDKIQMQSFTLQQRIGRNPNENIGYRWQPS